MKKFDLACLNNDASYKKFGVVKNMHGIIIELGQNYAATVFFNPRNASEFTLLNVNKNDISLDKEILPENVKIELENNIEKIKSKENCIFSPPKFKVYDKVELLVEDEKYTKFGLHKGAIGFVIDDDIINNCVEVDFSGLDENSEHFGETFSISIDDLRIIAR